MKIIAVIPAFNEASVIGSVIKSVIPHVGEVVVVDDGSSDQTLLEAEKAGATAVRQRINRGQGAALQTGIDLALLHNADIIVTYDADGQFAAGEIPQLVEPLLLGRAEVVLGSRFIGKTNNIPSSRSIVLKLAIFITRIYTGLPITDVHNGFRAFSRQAAEQIKIYHRGMAHASDIVEQIKKHNFKIEEVPVTINYTDYSLRKGQRASNSIKIAWDLFLSRIIR